MNIRKLLNLIGIGKIENEDDDMFIAESLAEKGWLGTDEPFALKRRSDPLTMTREERSEEMRRQIRDDATRRRYE